MRWVVGLALLVGAVRAEPPRHPASSGAVFGAEPTLSHPDFAKKDAAEILQSERFQDFSRQVVASCQRHSACNVSTETYGRFKVQRITYPSGFWFQLNADPSVVETQVHEGTLEEWREAAPLLQRDFYDVGARPGLDLFPHSQRGGGHLSVGRAPVFSGNSLLLRNFTVYLENHPEFSTFINRGRVHQQSEPVYYKDRDAPKDFENFSEEWFFSGERPTVAEVARRYDRRVAGLKGKEFATNLSNLVSSSDAPISPGEERVELRGYAPFRSAGHLVSNLEVLDRLLIYLQEHQGEALRFRPPPLGMEQFYRRLEQWHIDRSAAMFDEIGLKWENYRRYFAPVVRGRVPDRHSEAYRAAASVFEKVPAPCDRNAWHALAAVGA